MQRIDAEAARALRAELGSAYLTLVGINTSGPWLVASTSGRRMERLERARLVKTTPDGQRWVVTGRGRGLLRLLARPVMPR